MQNKRLKEVFDHFTQSLTNIYSLREAETISQMIFMEVFQFSSRADLVFGYGEKLTDIQSKLISSYLNELLQGRPVQHILGLVFFDGLELEVNEHALIPRPETEELVSLIAETIPQDFSGHITDFGTGSGCIALALKNRFKNTHVQAFDISEVALNLAQENAKRNNLEVKFQLFDLLDGDEDSLPMMDIIVSNPPYIPWQESKQMDKAVVDYEPHLALFSPDDDPLIFYRRLLDISTKKLKADGYMFFEVHHKLGVDCLALAKTYYPNSVLKVDLQQNNRFIIIKNKAQ